MSNFKSVRTVTAKQKTEKRDIQVKEHTNSILKIPSHAQYKKEMSKINMIVKSEMKVLFWV